MRDHPNNYEELGYIRRVESVYWKELDITTVFERVYDPSQSPKKLIAEFHVAMYKGKPDMEKTKEKYRVIKTVLWNEDMSGVGFVTWTPPAKTKEELEKEKEEQERAEELCKIEESISKNLEEWQKNLTEEEKEKILIRRIAERKTKEIIQRHTFSDNEQLFNFRLEQRQVREKEEDSHIDLSEWEKMRQKEKEEAERRKEIALKKWEKLRKENP